MGSFYISYELKAAKTDIYRIFNDNNADSYEPLHFKTFIIDLSSSLPFEFVHNVLILGTYPIYIT